jgi:hypothetical protein
LSDRPTVAFDDLVVREATADDAEALEALRCGSPEYAQEVERFLHEKALARHLNRAHTSSHRLLVFTDPEGRVVGAAAHRPADIPFPPGTDGRERGTRLVFAALDVSCHGSDLPSGIAVSQRLMDLLLLDVAKRGAGRLVEGTVHKGNGASLGMCARAGLDPVQRKGDYVQVLGALPK